MLGFVSERYPKGGALTLNTVSAIGLLSAGIVGSAILGASFDENIHERVVAKAPALAENATIDAGFMWMEHETISPEKATAYIATLPTAEQAPMQEAFDQSDREAGRDVLRFAAGFPAVLFVVFGFIALYFKSKGGYKPIELEAATF